MPRGPELPAERVERELRAMLAGLEPGTQLPPTTALAAQLHTSKTTLRRVLGKLASEDLVVVRHGWGTFRA